MKMIFDIGMHRGDDAGYYLAKGFKVVSVEPFPEYVGNAKVKFSAEIASGQMIIIPKAITDRSGDTISFFVNREKDDSHTTRKDLVDYNISSNIHHYDELIVPTISLGDLFDEFGVPYYLKCDIEGADEQVLDQLVRDTRRPDFVSFEMSEGNIIEKISSAGYQSFQLVNQWLNPTLPIPNPPLEGSIVEVQFNGHMSGFFGREIPANKWMEPDRVSELYNSWIKVLSIDTAFATPGWADCHASMLSIADLQT